MNVADIMTTDVATCRTGENLQRAAQLMWDRRCGALPVLDETGAVVGLVTDRDACMAAYTQGRRLDDIAVETAMSRPARTCTVTATVDEAEDLMMAHAVRRLAVVDAAGRLAGLLSLDDIVRCGVVERDGAVDLERAALPLGEIARRTSATVEEARPEEGTDLGELVKNSLEVLKTLRDEVRADLNLAGQEMQHRWRRLETRLRAAETYAQEVRHEGALGLAALVESAREFRERLRNQPARHPRDDHHTGARGS